MGILKKVGKFGGIGLVSGLLGGKSKGKSIVGQIASAGGFGLAGLAMAGGKDKKQPTPVARTAAQAAQAAPAAQGENAEYSDAWDSLAKTDATATARADAAAAKANDGSTAESDEAKRIKKIRARRLGGGNGLTPGRSAESNFTKSF